MKAKKINVLIYCLQYVEPVCGFLPIIEFIKSLARNQIHNFVYTWLIAIPPFIFH